MQSTQNHRLAVKQENTKRIVVYCATVIGTAVIYCLVLFFLLDLVKVPDVVGAILLVGLFVAGALSVLPKFQAESRARSEHLHAIAGTFNLQWKPAVRPSIKSFIGAVRRSHGKLFQSISVEHLDPLQLDEFDSVGGRVNGYSVRLQRFPNQLTGSTLLAVYTQKKNLPWIDLIERVDIQYNKPVIKLYKTFEVGDPEFDSRFYLKTSSPTQAKAVLNASVRKCLMGLPVGNKGVLCIKQGSITFTEDAEMLSMSNRLHLQTLIPKLVGLAECLDQEKE